MPGIARALLSVSDKTGIVDFARGLANREVELLSTGGTAQALRDARIPVLDVAELTGFPEMLDGRVKTLHPKVHAGLLYLRDNEEHQAAMKAHGLSPIDLVCVNLYPFEQTVARCDVTFTEAVENIDIGGPTLIRSAAKNMRFVTVVTDPTDYGRVLEEMDAHAGELSYGLRRELAQKAFARTASYNAAIAQYLSGELDEDTTPPFVLAYGSGTELRYGENPHQKAFFYRDRVSIEPGIAYCEVLHGQAMSYNNYLDGDAAVEAVKELSDVPGVAVVKHSNPCGFATGPTLAAAFEAAWAGDPVSAFGSVIAVNRPFDSATAGCLKGRRIDVLIAPDYEPDALAYLAEKKTHTRVLKLNAPCTGPTPGRAVRQITGGILVQDRDAKVMEEPSSVTAKSFPMEKIPLVEFGIKACKHVKSNAIVLVREWAPGCYSVLGMGAGQPNRVDALRKLALTKARENIEILYEAASAESGDLEAFAAGLLGETVLISDAFFPFADTIEAAAQAGIRYVVQPGGSVRDPEVIDAADRLGIAMLVTGMRHFRH